MKTTSIYDWILANHKARTQIHQGGTSSSKTMSIEGVIWTYSLKSEIPLLSSIVSESLPHLKRGAIRDFKTLIGDDWNDDNFNKTDFIYHINKSQIEFFSVDQASKLQSRRDILFMNEANNIKKSAYDQLDVRTKRKIFIDFNPTSSFWAHDLIGQPGVVFKKSTYLDNGLLDPRIKKAIESRKDRDSNWWRVFGMGEIGKIEGLIFPDFEIIPELPDGLQTDGGLDFGFTNDPSAFGESGIQSDTIYVNEHFYDYGLTNQDICKKFKEIPVPKDYFIYADCAEPKSIEEIRREGYNIKPCIKGPDSIHIGIDFIKRYKLKVTARSVSTIKDLRNYSWAMDKDEKYIQKPEPGFDHGPDYIRYSLNRKLKAAQITQFY